MLTQQEKNNFFNIFKKPLKCFIINRFNSFYEKDYSYNFDINLLETNSSADMTFELVSLDYKNDIYIKVDIYFLHSTIVKSIRKLELDSQDNKRYKYRLFLNQNDIRNVEMNFLDITQEITGDRFFLLQNNKPFLLQNNISFLLQE